MQQYDTQQISMKKFNIPKRFSFGLSFSLLSFLVLFFGVLLFASNIYITNEDEERNSILKQQLSITADKIEDIIESRLYILDELESYVRVMPEIDQAAFEVLAQTMLERDPVVRSLQLARNSVISHIYPVTNNEEALGHFLLDDANQKADVLLMYKLHTATISGPLKLRQGGKGLVVRQPISINNASSELMQNWGLSILIVDWNDILQETDLLSLGDSQSLALRKRIGSSWGSAFWGNDELFTGSDESVIVDIRLPNCVWQLAINSGTNRTMPISSMVLIVCVIVLLLVYFLLQVIHRLTWKGPAALAGAFILLCGVIAGMSYYSVSNDHRQQLREKAEVMRVNIRSRLKDSLDYIQLLIPSRTSDNLSRQDFQNKVGEFVATHPELINITWIDAKFTIRDVAPLKGNQQIIGLEINMEEPRRASRLAKELRLPVYTRPFVSIQGPVSFEVWVPVYRGDEFMGLFAGVYSVSSLFQTVLSKAGLSNYGVSMVTHDGRVVDSTLLKDDREVKFSQTVALSPPGYDIALSLDRYKSEMWRWDIILLAMLAFSLAMGVFWGMFVLLRARTELQQRYQQLSDARDALHREKELSQVTLLSIGDGVITMDVDGRVNSLNPVAENITQWSGSEAEGKLLFEVLPLLDVTHQHSIEETLFNCLKEAMSGISSSTMGFLSSKQQYSLRCTFAPIRNKQGKAIGSVLVLHDITEMHLMTQELEHQAKHDFLTGLVNRLEFEERLLRAVTIARSDNCQHGLLYLDLDQFKVVNDTCGHLAGDELLKQLTALLQESIRGSDTLARLGGDEFGVLLMNCSLPQAKHTAEILRQQVYEFRFVWEDKSFSLGISIGLVMIDQNTDSHTRALSTADIACYMAKEAGRNQLHVYTEDDEETSIRHGEMHWVARITAALAEGRFVLYRQTILPLADNHAGKHYEMLIRMQEEDGTLISPGAFLPAAERYDMMIQIDRWVLKSTLDFFRQHPQELDELMLCSINVSAQSLSNEDFLLDFKDTLMGEPQLCSKLCFEITETSAISNMVQARYFISSLKELGCRFALDDFGSGMSSFSYLKNLPVDYLKIDGSFVKDCAKDVIDLALVKSVNDIGHVMNMKTIAEWVEDEATLEVLKILGVDYVQGYAVDKPQALRPLIISSRIEAIS